MHASLKNWEEPGDEAQVHYSVDCVCTLTNSNQVTENTQYIYYGLSYIIMYMKRDHLGFFINIEFLAWLDSPFYVECNGKSFKRIY